MCAQSARTARSGGVRDHGEGIAVHAGRFVPSPAVRRHFLKEINCRVGAHPYRDLKGYDNIKVPKVVKQTYKKKLL